ncbi:MAG: metallophosphoesterase family protein [Bacteroidales bacterium]|nr:metallophosphoesterase family protein [Bacteroidales bacterium]
MGQASALNILQLSDIHGADFLIDEIKSELEKADLVVLAGDITHFGHANAAGTILRKITSYNENVLAVSGNCDYPDVEDYLLENGYGIHGSFRENSGWLWAGIGGSLPCPGRTPNEFEEPEVKEWLDSLRQIATGSLDFLLVHQPPANTLNDRLSTGEHVGSRQIRNFIEEMEPLVCMTAHIHEGIGIDRIGSTLIVNPGPFRTGKYAVISISGKNSVNAELKQITA